MKLNEDTHKRIVQAVEAGASYPVAAAAAGLSPRVFRTYLQRGRVAAAGFDNGEPVHRDELPYYELLRAVDLARAKAEVALSALIIAKARGGGLVERRSITHRDGSTEVVERFEAGDWRAAAWHLERTSPSRWARTGVRADLPNEADAMELLAAGDEELFALAAELAVFNNVSPQQLASGGAAP